MKHLSFSLCLLMLGTTAAQAACYADYKAKQDGPLRLHYGVAEVSGDCTTDSAASQLDGRLGDNGWQLLNADYGEPIGFCVEEGGVEHGSQIFTR